MASSFSLTKDDQTFDLNVDGQVSQQGDPVGSWATDPQNAVVVTLGEQSQVVFEVEWRFNEHNQCCLHSDGTEVFNFNKVDQLDLPYFYTFDAVLRVRPRRSHSFEFQLRGEWDIDANHDMQITINGVASSLNGYVQDRRSRFMYYYWDKENLSSWAILGFVGEWQHSNEDGTSKLSFSYKREDGSSDTFELPASIAIDRSVNQLVYEYEKGGRKRRIQLVGFLSISDSFEVIYSLDRQVSRTGDEQVAETRFAIQTVITNEDFTGDIKLQFARNDGSPGTTSLVIGGQFTAVLGEADLQVGFNFKQLRHRQTVTTVFGFAGQLSWDSGDSFVTWKFESNSATDAVTLEIGSEILLGQGGRIDTRLNLVSQSGQIQHVRFLIGISF